MNAWTADFFFSALLYEAEHDQCANRYLHYLLRSRIYITKIKEDTTILIALNRATLLLTSKHCPGLIQSAHP
jgi:hypothetical protein